MRWLVPDAVAVERHWLRLTLAGGPAVRLRVSALLRKPSVPQDLRDAFATSVAGVDRGQPVLRLIGAG